MTTIDDLFKGYEIEVCVDAMRHSSAQAQAIRQTIAQEKPQKLRYTCIVAESVNEALGAPSGTKPEEWADFFVGNSSFRLNNRGKSQFGMTPAGVPYLTTSLVSPETGIRYGLTWRGEDVPVELQTMAVLHDEGKNTQGIVVFLPFDTAEKHIIGEKNGSKTRDRRKNHDTDKNGNPYPRAPRRHHMRICRKDLALGGSQRPF
jgi:hypothetical protein